jgi:hypothetical protein
MPVVLAVAPAPGPFGRLDTLKQIGTISRHPSQNVSNCEFGPKSKRAGRAQHSQGANSHSLGTRL